MTDDPLAAATLEKAQAEARQAVAAAVKAEQDNADAASPAAAALRTAQAAQATAAADAGRIGAMLPDLSRVAASTLAVDTPVMLWGDVLQAQAVTVAAAQVAVNVGAALGADARVLVTTDPDLTTADATYADVHSGLTRLATAATALLAEPVPGTRRGILPVGTVSAVAAAVPALLSLFSANRTLNSTALVAPERAALAAVTEQLLHKHVVVSVTVDGARTVPGSGLVAAVDTLAGRRTHLATRRAEVGSVKAAAAAHADVLAAATDLCAGLDALIAAVDGFVTSVHAVPAGGTTSALVTAALAETLHTPGGIDHVLVLSVQGGAAYGTTDNRPMFFADRFATVATAGISWLLVATATGETVAAGVETGYAQAHGAIGERITVSTQ